MGVISLPVFEPKTRDIGGKAHIFDLIRKKYVVLTPEEIVRQGFINYLITELSYPKSMIVVERQLKLGPRGNRSDIRILENDGTCFMLVECKSFKTTIDQQTFDQAAKYTSALKAPYLVTTNGTTTYCCAVNHRSGETTFLSHIPPYPAN